MTIGRRISSDARRRRVLAYQCSRDGDRGTSPDRRMVEKLRQARRPAAIYGASVNRRLRGRWFSLVPVRRRAMAGASVAILSTATMLALAHWAAITWQPLAYREGIARPLRLDRPDSFGTWARATFLAVAAGASLLVYQLRRYRNDDYRGSYRIWPPVIILMALASLDCVVGLVPWCGELIDWLLGKRVAMAGSDWIRIGITVGGAGLALRLVAEVRHSKLAMVMLLLSIACFATPLASRWGILLSDTPLKWWLITSAPLMAAATLCVACGAYLRKLFREVRHLDEDDQLSLRFQQWKRRAFPAKAMVAADPPDPPRAAKRTVEKPRPSKPAATANEPVVSQTPDFEKVLPEPAPRKNRFASLFGRSKRVNGPVPDPAVTTKKPEPAAEVAPATAAPVTDPAKPVVKPPPVSAATHRGPAAATKRRWGLGSMLGRWLRRSNSAAQGPESKSNRKAPAKSDSAGSPASRPASARSQNDDDHNNDGGDDSSIDWASMGKAERRRLRRELKRSGDAA